MKTLASITATLLVVVSFLLPRETKAADTNEIWISARTNGLGTLIMNGNGSITNPFWGDFDYIMRSMTTNMTIHLLPGTHYTGAMGGARRVSGFEKA